MKTYTSYELEQMLIDALGLREEDNQRQQEALKEESFYSLEQEFRMGHMTQEEYEAAFEAVSEGKQVRCNDCGKALVWSEVELIEMGKCFCHHCAEAFKFAP